MTLPSKVCGYLGLEVDSIKMELRLPKDKLEKLKSPSLQRVFFFAESITNNFKDEISISKRELESLGWLLSHCSQGRTHSRRFYDLYKVILNNNLHRVKARNSFVKYSEYVKFIISGWSPIILILRITWWQTLCQRLFVY